MKAFIIGRPYHLFNSINFVISKEVDGDAFILNEYTNAKKDYLAVKEAGIFRAVYFVEESSIRPKSLLKEILFVLERGLWPMRILQRSIHEPMISASKLCQYSEIYSATPGSFVLSLLKVTNAKFYVIEDGTGTYSGRNFLGEQSLKHKLYCTIFKSGALNLRVEGVYVYRPDMCRTKISNNILKLPTISTERKDLMTAYNHVFTMENEVYNARFIFLSQRLIGLNLSMNLYELIDKLMKEAGIDDYCYRLHPAEVTDSLKNKESFTMPYEMWELLCFNYVNNEKVLITINSSAVFSPFKLYNVEPDIVFLFKVVGLQGEELRISEEIVDSIKNGYSNPAKIHVPCNEKEFVSVLTGLDKERI